MQRLLYFVCGQIPKRILPAFSLLLLLPAFAFAQLKTVTGTVLDETGKPVTGASVTVKNSTTGTSTDNAGKFSINVPQNAVLVISSINYEAQEVIIGNNSTLALVLKSATGVLSDVVVVGYGTQKKVNVSGAVKQVSGDILQNRPVANLAAGLQGAIPNLIITNGNAPGQGASFNVRGYTSLNGGGPLVLVDGVVQDPNLINPNDVATVSVLQDAASAAIYGARAAYGVVLITTKSGKRNQPVTINISSSYGKNEATRLPKYMNSWDYVNYMNTASMNDGGGAYFSPRIYNGVLAHFSDPVNNPSVLYDPTIDGDGKYVYVGNTDWTGALYQPGAIQQNNISISGGSQNTTFYLSYGNSRQDGFLASYNDYYKRHTINTNITSDVAKWLTVTGKVRYTFSNEDHPTGGQGGSYNNTGLTPYGGQLKNDLRPIMPITHPDGNWAGQGNFTNPFAIGAEGGYNRSKINDLWLTGALTVRPVKNVNLNLDYSFNPYSKNNNIYSRRFTEYHADSRTNIYPWTNPNMIQLNNNNDYYHALNIYGDYKISLGQNNFKLLAGYNEELKTNKAYTASRTDLIDNDLPAINRATGTQTVNGSETSWAVQGYFFRFNYDFANKYYLEVNSRYDGSSKFPSGKRFVFAPSVSAAWRISQEKFWQPGSWFNELKLKGSYGTLGNQTVGDGVNFPYISSYNTNTALSYILGSTTTLPVSVSPGGLISPNFSWEKVRQWNVGMESEFLNHRLSLTYDYYNRYTTGMLVSGQPLPAVLGTGVPRENSADLKTKGWELTLGWKDNISKDLSYHLAFNIADAQAVITKFNNPTGSLSTYYVGRKIGEIWGFRSAGLFQSDAEVASWIDQSKISGNWSAGDVKYVDIDGDKKLDWQDQTLDKHGDLTIIGNSTARYNYGFNGGVTWKNINLDFFLQGVAKQDFNPDQRFFGITSEWDVPMELAGNFWSPSNTGAYLPKPRMNNWWQNTGQAPLSGYLQNNAYLRVKQLTLGYTLNTAGMRRAHIDGIQIYFTGQNILTFTKLSKLYDPEYVSNPSQSNLGYPAPKTYSVGINITLK